MTPQELLIWFAGQAAHEGYVCPQLNSPQALHVAEVALGKLGAAAGLVRPEPAREPAALTAGPAVVDSPTALLPVVRRARTMNDDGDYSARVYAAGRGTL